MDIKQENKELRKLLWLRHGCQDLYGDDGEMQCSKCMIDFKRDSVEDIERHLTPAAPDSEGRAVYCGGCGYTHVPGTKCPTT